MMFCDPRRESRAETLIGEDLMDQTNVRFWQPEAAVGSRPLTATLGPKPDVQMLHCSIDTKVSKRPIADVQRGRAQAEPTDRFRGRKWTLG